MVRPTQMANNNCLLQRPMRSRWYSGEISGFMSYWCVLSFMLISLKYTVTLIVIGIFLLPVRQKLIQVPISIFYFCGLFEDVSVKFKCKHSRKVIISLHVDAVASLFKNDHKNAWHVLNCYLTGKKSKVNKLKHFMSSIFTQLKVYLTVHCLSIFIISLVQSCNAVFDCHCSR